MKIKGILLTVIYLLVLVGPISSSLHAAVAVKDIEYLNGKDFIQLYFKIDKMIPIPDVFYPEKGNNTRIIMRMSDVDFKPGKNVFTFDSSVIDNIKVNKRKKHTDVEIRLKEQVNYRVFTNPKGLYIEFPKVKNIMAKKSPQPAAQTRSAPLPKDQPAPQKVPKPARAVPETLKLAKNSPQKPAPQPASQPVRNQPEQPVHDTDGVTYIKDIVMAHKGPDRVSFEVMMSGTTDFNVIPIPDDPVRLAIDFKDARAKRINRTINALNVKKIRGAYNSTSVYRLVFDLKYLKHHKVTPRGNIVEIVFSNKKFQKKPARKNILAQKNKPPRARHLNNPVKPAPQNKTHKTAHAPADKIKHNRLAKNTPPRKIASKDDLDIPIVETNPAPIKVARDTKVKPAPAAKKSAPNPAPKVTVQSNDVQAVPVSNDFFGEEKSQVLLPQATPVKPPKGPNQTIWETQTIGGGTVKYKGSKMSFNFHDADLKDVIKIIAQISKMNIVLDPGVSGRITSQLKEVPWDQALELFLKINGLAQVQEGNIIRIGLVEKLKREAEQRRQLMDAQRDEGSLMIVTRALSFAKVTQVKTILEKQLSNRGEILTDIRSNTLIISDLPSRMPIIDKLISALDTAVPQVSIEARIVETRANYVESFGIQWGYNFVADPQHGNQTTLKFPHTVQVSGNNFTSENSPLEGPLGGYAVNLPASGATSGTLFSLGNVSNTFRLDMALSAMQASGNGRIISAPKTTTQNNMQAVIQQGRQIPVQTIQNNTITVQYKIAALELKVTPQITSKGTVICTLEVNNNAADFANQVKDIPPIITQAIKTTVAVEDGGTIVIGGMYRIEKSVNRGSVPVLSKIPILGNLFKNKTKRNEQIELLVFITPRILK